jgi:hypothetical protein
MPIRWTLHETLEHHALSDSSLAQVSGVPLRIIRRIERNQTKRFNPKIVNRLLGALEIVLKKQFSYNDVIVFERYQR